MSFDHYELTEGGVYRAKAASEIVYQSSSPPAELRAAVVNEDDRVLEFEFTNTDQDRHETQISSRGMLLTPYRSNPAFCAAHAKADPQVPNIGRTVAIRKILEGREHILGRVCFAGDDQRHSLAEMYYLLFKDDFLRAVSVGIIPHEFRVLEPEEATPKNGFLREFGVKVLQYTRSELVECSSVNVGSNRGALKRDETLRAIRDVGKQCSVDEGFLHRFLTELDRSVEVTARPLGEELASQHAIDWDDDPAEDRGWGDWGDLVPEIRTEPELRIPAGTEVELDGESIGLTGTRSELEELLKDRAARASEVEGQLVAQIELAEQLHTERDEAREQQRTTELALEDAQRQLAELRAELERIESEPSTGVPDFTEVIRAELSELRRHFDEALVELFGQTQDDREHVARAVLALVAQRPQTPVQTPVAPVEDASPPARSTPTVDIEQLAPVLAGAVRTAIQEHRGLVR